MTMMMEYSYWSLLGSVIVGALFIIVIYVYYYYVVRKNKFDELGILNIRPMPIVGNMGPVMMGKCALVDVINEAYYLSKEAAYVGFWDFSEPVILVRSPELIKDMTIKYFEHFIDHRKIVDVSQDPLFGINLFALSGDKWKQVRSILSPAFTSSKMKMMYKLMSECGKNLANYLTEEEEEDNPPSGGIMMKDDKIVDTKDLFSRYTNDVIASCAFGIGVDSFKNPNNSFYVLGRKTTKLEGVLGVKFFFLKSFPRLSKWLKLKLIDPIAEKFFAGIVRETVETRDREGITRPDMMQLMMETRKNSNNDPSSMLSIKDMIAQAFSFFFGGFDSSSTFMCFAAYEIAVNPEVQKKLQEEIDAVIEESNGEEPTYEVINNQMSYLDAVINEALRKYLGASFLDRICVKEFVLPPAIPSCPSSKPVKLKPGDTVWFPAFSIHRDPKYWPEPDKFHPQRFFDERLRNKIDPFTYLPFGQGPRGCIGTRFALLESKVVLFHLLAKCNLKPSPRTLVPLQFNKGSFALTAKAGFWLQFQSRHQSIHPSSS